MIMPTPRAPQGSGGLAAVAAAIRRQQQTGPTIWGLDPLQLHDRFWASRGVQVVRPDEPPIELAEHAPFYLLMEPKALAIFDPSTAEEALSMAADSAHLMYVRVNDTREHGPRERVVTDSNNRFLRFERLYDRPHTHIARAALTRRVEIARFWQSAESTREGWRSLRRSIPKSHRATLESDGMLYDGFVDAEVATFVRDLTRFWVRPASTIGRAVEVAPRVWRDREGGVDAAAKVVGPVWIGAGRQPDGGSLVIGPAVLWDDPAVRPEPEPVRWESAPWQNAGPVALPQQSVPLPEPALLQSLAQARNLHNFFKRVFDIGFSIFALLLTLWTFPLVALAILLEDGWPIFFAHRRETTGGREFPCLKFRSMRKDAEEIKKTIRMRNEVDGPQFFIEDDPRLTRVGRFIRKYRLDELPQFFNVLAGHMSVVGPRPSPFNENQFCPAWREARLSVRPGITGLWQIKRTRQPGTDFQEWIRYDIEYVENASWSLDLLIIWKTCLSVLRGADEHRKQSRA
jgi:lipopolysaccharide/colanic/teichoic acid biosynthesis glycosyltransferase